MQKLAIFGGTFNPIHWGHLLVAETALSQIGLDRVFWIPTRHPPHKAEVLLLPYAQRWEMVKLAIEDHPQFALASEPLHSSFAMDTLRQMQSEVPQSQWFWIVGLDTFESLPRWRDRLQLSNCGWLVAPRIEATEMPSVGQTIERCQDVATLLAAQAVKLEWQLINLPPIGITSSLIRQRCQQGRSIRYFVPESVRHYILCKKLYQASTAL